MLFNTRENTKSVLEEMSYLPIDEGTDSETEQLSLFKIYERPNTDQYMINVEEGFQFCHENNIGFDELIEKVSEMNRICEADICYSIRPSTICMNEEAHSLYKSLIKEGKEVYARVNQNPLAKAFGDKLQEAVETDNSEAIDAIVNEGLGDFFAGVKRGIGQGVKDTAQGTLAVGLNAAKNAVSSGVRTAGEGAARRRLDSFAPTQAIQNFAQAHGVGGEGLEAVGDFVNGMKRSLAGTVGDLANGGAGAVADKLRDMLDQVSQKISFFGRKLASGDYDQNKKSLFQKGLDALNRLKEAIMNKLRGIRK
jgi:hypothetical protein